MGEGGGDWLSSSVHLQWPSSSSSVLDGAAAEKFPLPKSRWTLDASDPEETGDARSWRRIKEQSEQVWCGRGVLGFSSGAGIFSVREGSKRPERCRMEEQGFEGFGE